MPDLMLLSSVMTLPALASHGLTSIGCERTSLLATTVGQLEGEAYAKALGLALTVIAIVIYLSV